VFGEAIWDPVQLAGKISIPAVAMLAMLGAAVATLTVNMSANVVSPSYDFANVAPHKISRRTGGFIVGFLGVASQPWLLLSSPSGFIFDWLGTYGGGMGVIAGVMIVDYWIVRRRALSVTGLYERGGPYSFSRGWNVRALVATAIGMSIAWGGFLLPALSLMTTYGWFAGFFGGALSYWALAVIFPMKIAADDDAPHGPEDGPALGLQTAEEQR
jgi:NCS1 family nucleobase:cation symporter-1